jgi:hypothetical protein
MDPDQCLREILELLEDLRGGDDTAREEAAEKLDALADWLRRGGFPPDPRKLKGASP